MALHLLAQHLAANFRLELRGLDAGLLELGEIALARESAIVLEGRDGLDAQAQLLVTDRDALALGLLEDQRFLDQVVDDLLGEPSRSAISGVMSCW
jgi:hypothetical protein